MQNDADTSTSLSDELILELSELCGIIPEYFDVSGKRRIPSAETKLAILRAMKLRVDSLADIRQEVEERRWRLWKSFIEPVKIVSVNEPELTVPVYIPVREGEEHKLLLSWFIEDAKGQRDEFTLAGDAITVSEQQWIENIRYIKVTLVNRTPRDIGYYGITVKCSLPGLSSQGGLKGRANLLRKTARLIITPDECYLPTDQRIGKTWGLSISLYAIRSATNWGIGDFTDLKKIVQWVADLKGAFVGINPLHALPNTRPFGVSPYSPISRLYRNFIYLDVENIPEVMELEGAGITAETVLGERDELRKGPLLDYEKVSSLKDTILRKAFDLFYEKHYKRNTLRGRDFKRYRSKEGCTLESFATYMAIAEFFQEHRDGPGTGASFPCFSWQEWPKEYRSLSSKTVGRFKKDKKKEILFYQYVQWLIDEQMKEIAEKATDLTMAIGLYHDLAVGSVGGGSDAWGYQDAIAGGVDVGAPPDDFNNNGQNWGFPPLIPEKLKETGYQLFIETIRKNMKYGGALRIDHALGMFRLFWIPKGMPATEGAYIRCPSEDFLRIIALESVLNRTTVIAEDLGTIGENARAMLQRFKMLSYRLFYFERNYPDPSFLPPEKYPEMALCAVTTHDLPTLPGYWAGRDLEVKKQLGLYREDPLWQEHLIGRELDRRRILVTLKSQGLLRDDYPAEPMMIPEMTPDLCLAIYRYLALTPCKLVLVSLDDVIGAMDQQNMPGTTDAYPNWMKKTARTLEEIVSDKNFLSLSEMFRNTHSVSH
ncbi:MAG: 4-alpha-glucanotransferase [Thermodesulfovibrionales bacterium]|jgi:4-alpha-glucanotransferase